MIFWNLTAPIWMSMAGMAIMISIAANNYRRKNARIIWMNPLK